MNIRTAQKNTIINIPTNLMYYFIHTDLIDNYIPE